MTKKILVFVFVGALLVLLNINSGFAKGRFGCDNCDCFGKNYDSRLENAEFKKFKTETLPLRKEISQKRFEIEQEYLSEHRDENKITKLKDEIKTLRDKLYEIKAKYGVQAKRFSPRCY